MTLTVTFGTQFAGRAPSTFPDDAELIRFGRAVDCDVGFPEEMTAIGHDHFALRREAGGYKFVINSRYPVFVDGHEAIDDMEVPDQCMLHLGRADGPALRLTVVRPQLRNTLPTEPLKPSFTIGQLVERNRKRIRVIAAATAVVALAVTATLFIIRQLSSDVADVVILAKEAEGNTDISSLVARVRDSVYFATVVDRFGESLGGGTAWVVALPDGRKAFATNAHVAEIFNEVMAKNNGERLVVRSPAAGHADYEIASVAIHPGYAAFHDFRVSKQEQIESGVLRPFRENGYDVALLLPNVQADFGEPLAIAGPDELRALKPGEPVFFVGYPMERVDATDVKAPSPTSQRGIITNLTTFFLNPSATDSQLVQHSLPSAGGASGSPIFNSQGKVIALHNAGSYFFMEQGRIPLAALVNFGQRADLLLELIDGAADASMPRYRASWETEVRQLERPAAAAAEDQIAAFESDHPGAVRAVERDVSLYETNNQLFGGRVGTIVTLTLKAGNQFLFIVHTNERRTLSLVLFDATSGHQYVSADGAGPLVTARGKTSNKIAVRLAIVATDLDTDGNPNLSPVAAKLVVMRSGP